MIYRLAQHVEFYEKDGESYLMSRTPLCILRLNRSLEILLKRCDNGDYAAAASEVSVLEQLVGKGFVERLRTSPDQTDALPEVSIIIPVKDRAEELERCLTSLSRLNYPREQIRIIVVDDGSSDNSALVAQQFGALLIPSGGTGRGPAAARNVGAAAAGGEILAFIDSDCTASADWLAELVPAFSDAATAAVGGRVDGMCTESVVDRYETVMSSLSVSSRERTGNKGTDTFYLPSCNLLVRRSAFQNVNGFDDSMHVGEDVDLTWRLRDKGWSITYLHLGRILHEHRSTLRSFMSRRFDYGTSEGMLQILHPERCKRMVIPPQLALVLMLCLMAPLTGWWSLLGAAGVLAGNALSVRRRMARQRLPFGFRSILAGRLRALGSLVYYLCFHLVRYYSVVFIIAALFVPLLWIVYGAMVLCAAGVDHAIKKPQLRFPWFVVIYLLEHIAYGSGVFWGCLRHRCFSSYRVEIFRQAEVPA